MRRWVVRLVHRKKKIQIANTKRPWAVNTVWQKHDARLNVFRSTPAAHVCIRSVSYLHFFTEQTVDNYLNAWPRDQNLFSRTGPVTGASAKR